MLIALDVSRHQGRIDWSVAARRLEQLNGSSAPKIVVMRCTVGDYYRDDRFIENWANSGTEGFVRSPYHVVTPEREVSAQIRNYRQFFGDREINLITHYNGVAAARMVLDVELERGQTVSRITSVLTQLQSELDYPIIYTRKYWWEQWVSRKSYWKASPLHIAHYVDTTNPLIPVDWQDWNIHQYSADGNMRGAEFGASSYSIDINRVRPEFVGYLPEPTLEMRVSMLEREVEDLKRRVEELEGK